MMKKLLFTFATGAFLATGSLAQTNLDLESWTGTGGTIECDGWGSLNTFTLLGAPQTLFQETADPGEGSNSAKLTTGYWPGAKQNFGAPSDTVSGLFNLGDYTLTEGLIGFAYTDKPVSVDFMLKPDAEPNDTSAVIIQLTRWDTTLGAQVFVAQAVVIAPDSGAWQSVTATLTYFSADTPDTLEIICASSMGTLFGAPMPIIGSSISVDGFVINVPVGVNEKRDENVKFSVYPNPSSDYFVINNGSSKSKMDVKMFDINGKVVRNLTGVTGGELTLNVKDLASGSYMIQVTSGGKQVIRQVIVQ